MPFHLNSTFLIFDSIAFSIFKGEIFALKMPFLLHMVLYLGNFSFSTTKTEYPFFDKFRAVEDPDNPPPIIMMSNSFKLLEFRSLSQIICFLLKQ